MHAPITVFPERRAHPRTDRRTDSFLVRTWREGSREGSNRFFVRNLRTGDESYLSGLQALAEFFGAQAEPESES